MKAIEIQYIRYNLYDIKNLNMASYKNLQDIATKR
jgi:hypothetical protein